MCNLNMHHAGSCMIRGPIDNIEFLQGWPENFPNDNTIKIFILVIWQLL